MTSPSELTSEQFEYIISNLFCENEELRNQCRSVIDNLLSQNSVLIFLQCSQAALQPNATKITLYNVLVLLKRALINFHQLSYAEARQRWFSGEFQQVREGVKTSSLFCLNSDHVEVRNLAANVITLILEIEKQDWKDFFIYFVDQLCFQNVSSSLKFGIIELMKDVILSDLIFSPNQDPASFPREKLDSLFEYMCSIINLPNLELGVYFQVVECISSWFDKFPQYFLPNLEKYVVLILNSLGGSFPFADEKLYRNYHHLMLLLFKKYYQFADNFVKTLANYTMRGFQSQFNFISLDFWASVYQHEKKLHNVVHDLNHDPFHFTRLATEHLYQSYLYAILNYQQDVTDPDYLSLKDASYLSSRALKRFTKSFLLSDDENYRILVTEIQKFIELMNQQEQTLNTIAAQLYAINSTCTIKNGHLDEFAAMYFLRIIENCKYPNDAIKVIALKVLAKYLKNHVNFCADRNTAIFDVIDFNLTNRNEKVLERTFNLFWACCKYFPTGAKLNVYENLFDLFMKAQSNEFILDSPLNHLPRCIIASFFDSLKEVQMGTEANRQKKENLIVASKKLLNITLADLSKGLGMLLNHQQSYIASCIKLLQQLLNFLGLDCSDCIEGVYKLMVNIIFHLPNYMEDAIFVLITICELNIPSLKVPEFLESVMNCCQHAMTSGNPYLIGKGALLLGWLFKFMKQMGERFLRDCLPYTFELFIDEKIDNRRDYYANVVGTIGIIIGAVGHSCFPIEYRDQYFEKIIQLSQQRYDTSDANDMEEISVVFVACAIGFTNLLVTYQHDDEFLQRFHYKRYGSIVTEFIGYLAPSDTRKAYKESQLMVYLELLENFIKVFESKYNAALNSRKVKRVITDAAESKNPKLKKKGQLLLRILERL